MGEIDKSQDPRSVIPVNPPPATCCVQGHQVSSRGCYCHNPCHQGHLCAQGVARWQDLPGRFNAGDQLLGVFPAGDKRRRRCKFSTEIDWKSTAARYLEIHLRPRYCARPISPSTLRDTRDTRKSSQNSGQLSSIKLPKLRMLAASLKILCDLLFARSFQSVKTMSFLQNLHGCTAQRGTDISIAPAILGKL